MKALKIVIIEIVHVVYRQQIVYGIRHQNKEAISAYKAALGIQRQNLWSDHITCFQTNHNLAIVKSQLGNFLSALKAYDKAIVIIQWKPFSDQKDQLAESLQGKGEAYKELCQYKDAIECLEECLTIRRSSVTASADLQDLALSVAGILHSIGIL